MTGQSYRRHSGSPSESAETPPPHEFMVRHPFPDEMRLSQKQCFSWKFKGGGSGGDRTVLSSSSRDPRISVASPPSPPQSLF